MYNYSLQNYTNEICDNIIKIRINHKLCITAYNLSSVDSVHLPSDPLSAVLTRRSRVRIFSQEVTVYGLWDSSPSLRIAMFCRIVVWSALPSFGRRAISVQLYCTVVWLIIQRNRKDVGKNLPSYNSQRCKWVKGLIVTQFFHDKFQLLTIYTWSR